MRVFLFILVILLCSSCASSYDPSGHIRGPFSVIGEGDSESQAREDGFRIAVGMAMGTAVRSERVVKNSEVALNYVLAHSAGYVERADIKSVAKEGGRFRVSMVIFVRPTVLDDYVLFQNNSTKSIDGKNLSYKLGSRFEEFKSGDDFLNSILNDYPHKALEVKQKNFKVVVNDRRQRFVQIDLSYRFSPRYLSSLSQVFERVKNGTADRRESPSINLQFDKFIYFHNSPSGNRHVFSDVSRFAMVKNKLLSPYSFKATFKSTDDRDLYQVCLNDHYRLSSLGRDQLGHKSWDINCFECNIDDLWVDTRWEIPLDNGSLQFESLGKSLDQLAKIDIETELSDQCKH